jgi:GNAT superfamily N-acetyltransferase
VGEGGLVVNRLDSAAASDDLTVETVTRIINDAYAIAEAGLGRVGRPRTTAEAVRLAIGCGQVVVVCANERVVGTVQTRSLDEQTGWFGVLATAPPAAGRGIASALVRHVEAGALSVGCRRMQLELLAPRSPHPHTTWLAKWYASLGYEEVSRSDVGEFDPSIVDDFEVACDVVVCQKWLGDG